MTWRKKRTEWTVFISWMQKLPVGQEQNIGGMDTKGGKPLNPFTDSIFRRFCHRSRESHLILLCMRPNQHNAETSG